MKAPSLAVFLFTACGVLSAQTLQVVPGRVLVDEAAVVRAGGLQSGERITIQAELRDGEGHPWTQQAEFIAGADGVVDVSKQAPVHGSYDEVSAMGLIQQVSGQDDGVWPSSMMADAIAARLKQEHFPHRAEHWKYHHAGHRAGQPGIVPAWHGKITHPVSGRVVDMGGTPSGDAHSPLDAAPRVLEFLRQSLQKESNSL